MMRFEKMTKKDFLAFCVASVFGGIMVSIGGVGLLISNAIFHDGMGKVVGGAIFSLAMFVVTTFGLYLITGLSTKIITMRAKHVWSLPVCLFFNVVGIAISALLVYYSHVEIQEEAALFL